MPALIIVVLCIAGFFLFIHPGFFTNINPYLNQTVSPQNVSSDSVAGSSYQPYTGKYKMGNIATDSSGTEGMAIITNNFEGQYYVKKVSLQASKKGWYTQGKTNAEWLRYGEVEDQYPLAWNGGIMDVAHIPDRDWTSSGEQTSIQPRITITSSLSYSPPSTTTPYSIGKLDGFEIERQILSLTNNERSAQGVPPLIWDDRLATIARDHSEDMARNDYIGHVNSQGEDPTDRAIRHGYSVHKELGGGRYSEGIGENIAGMSSGMVLFTCPTETIQVPNSDHGVANAMMDAWMNHDTCQENGHRNNILHSQYSHIGIGVAYDGTMYIATQDFW